MENLITTLSQNNFRQYLNSVDKPLLIDFRAKWRGPCRAVAPKLDKLANELDDRIHVAKVNVDSNPAIPNW